MQQWPDLGSEDVEQFVGAVSRAGLGDLDLGAQCVADCVDAAGEVQAGGELVGELDHLFVFHIESHRYMVPNARYVVLRFVMVSPALDVAWADGVGLILLGEYCGVCSGCRPHFDACA